MFLYKILTPNQFCAPNPFFSGTNSRPLFRSVKKVLATRLFGRRIWLHVCPRLCLNYVLPVFSPANSKSGFGHNSRPLFRSVKKVLGTRLSATVFLCPEKVLATRLSATVFLCPEKVLATRLSATAFATLGPCKLLICIVFATFCCQIV
jgi:hypothetical protein